jgi:uncharacterized protein DUF6876
MVTAKQQLSLLDLASEQISLPEQRTGVSEDTSANSNEISTLHPYIRVLEQLGISAEAIPDPEDKNAVLKALLDSIGEDEGKLTTVLLCTDITIVELLAAGGRAERKRFYKALARKLEHELAHCTGTEQWYRHAGFWRYPILLTEGVMHLAEHGGRHNRSAFWLVDAIASYQGGKVLARHPFQVWKLVVTEAEGQSRCAKLVCTNGNNVKPIIEQAIEYTDFLLDEITLYASVEAVDATNQKKQVILLLPSEY